MLSIQTAIKTNMSSDSINALIKNQLNNLKKWNTQSISVDGTGSHSSTYSMGSVQLYVMIPNIASLNSAQQAIQQYLR